MLFSPWQQVLQFFFPFKVISCVLWSGQREISSFKRTKKTNVFKNSLRHSRKTTINTTTHIYTTVTATNHSNLTQIWPSTMVKTLGFWNEFTKLSENKKDRNIIEKFGPFFKVTVWMEVLVNCMHTAYWIFERQKHPVFISNSIWPQRNMTLRFHFFN